MRALRLTQEPVESAIDFNLPLMTHELSPLVMTDQEIQLGQEMLPQVLMAAEIITRQAVISRGPEMGLDYRKGLVAEYVRTQAMATTVEASTVQHRALYFNAYNTNPSQGPLGYSPDAILFRQQQHARAQRTHSGRTFARGDDRFARLYPR